MKEPGQVAYEAWCAATYVAPYWHGSAMKEQWAAVEAAVRNAALRASTAEIERLRAELAHYRKLYSVQPVSTARAAINPSPETGEPSNHTISPRK